VHEREGKKQHNTHTHSEKNVSSVSFLAVASWFVVYGTAIVLNGSFLANGRIVHTICTEAKYGTRGGRTKIINPAFG
jgi:hypothetical protein